MRKFLALTLVAGLLIATGCGKPKDTKSTSPAATKPSGATQPVVPPDTGKAPDSKPKPPDTGKKPTPVISLDAAACT